MLIESTALTLATSLLACPPECQNATQARTADNDVRAAVISAPRDDHRSHTSARTQNADGSVGSVRIEEVNGERTVWVNGEKVGADRIREKDGAVIILDKDGKVLHELPHVRTHADDAMKRIQAGDGEMLRGGDFDGKVVINGKEIDIKDFMKNHNMEFGDEFEFDGTHGRIVINGEEFDFGDGGVFQFEGQGDGPQVVAAGRPRIGVTMGEIDGALAEHLGVKDQGAFIITEVVKGLPAEKAGIRKHDVVIRVNGESATMDGLRKAVIDAKKDDEIRIRVMRQGDTKEFKVKVDSDSDVSFDSDSDSNVVRKFDVKFDSDSDSDSDFHWEFDSDSDSDFHFDMDRDFDFQFDSDHVKNIEEIKKKIHEAMKDGRFHGLVERFDDLPQLRELDLKDLNDFRVKLRDVQDLPVRIRERFGPDSNVWFGMTDHLEGALKDLDPETREKIHKSIEEAMKGVRQKFNVWHEDGGPRVFELFEGAGDDDDVIIFHEEGAPGKLRIKRQAAEGEGGERIVELKVEDDSKAADKSAPVDRLSKLEERMARLEKMLQQIADKLDR